MNPFQSQPPTIAGPFRDIIPLTPNDATVFPDVLCGFTVLGASGNVVVRTASGSIRTIPVASGLIIPVGIDQVLATGTTATGIFGYSLS